MLTNLLTRALFQHYDRTSFRAVSFPKWMEKFRNHYITAPNKTFQKLEGFNGDNKAAKQKFSKNRSRKISFSWQIKQNLF